MRRSHAGEYHQTYRHPGRQALLLVGSNGRIKPDWVMVDGHQERHPEGAYYLDWTEDGKRTRVSVGIDATAAYNSRVRKQRELDALASGLIVSNPIEDDSRLRIRSAIDDFLEEIQLSRQRKTWMGYCVSLRYSRNPVARDFWMSLDEVERKDLLRFAAFLRDTKKLSPRTVHNKFADVHTFVQAQGVPKLIGKNDHPRFIEQEVSIYEEDELSKLHAVCSPYHSTLYDFFLMSGFREQEAMHVFWGNVRSTPISSRCAGSLSSTGRRRLIRSEKFLCRTSCSRYWKPIVSPCQHHAHQPRHWSSAQRTTRATNTCCALLSATPGRPN